MARGLWLSQNINNTNLINQNYKSTRFWTPLFLCSAFIVHNTISMMIYKYANNTQPIPVLTCALLVISLTSVVGSLITSKRIPFYDISLIFLLITSLFTYFYHFWQTESFTSIFLSSQHVQRLTILLVLFLISFSIKNIPVVFFEKISYLGSFSYALYPSPVTFRNK